MSYIWRVSIYRIKLKQKTHILKWHHLTIFSTGNNVLYDVSWHNFITGNDSKKILKKLSNEVWFCSRCLAAVWEMVGARWERLPPWFLCRCQHLFWGGGKFRTPVMLIIWYVQGFKAFSIKNQKKSHSTDLIWCWCFLTKIHITLKYTSLILVFLAWFSHFFLRLLALEAGSVIPPKQTAHALSEDVSLFAYMT